MACNIFGWIHVALTKEIVLSSQRLSTLYFAGIVMLLNATSICQMFQAMIRSTCLCSRGSRPSREVDGLPVVGHFRNLLLYDQLSSFARMANYSVIRNL